MQTRPQSQRSGKHQDEVLLLSVVAKDHFVGGQHGLNELFKSLRDVAEWVIGEDDDYYRCDLPDDLRDQFYRQVTHGKCVIRVWAAKVVLVARDNDGPDLELHGFIIEVPDMAR